MWLIITMAKQITPIDYSHTNIVAPIMTFDTVYDVGGFGGRQRIAEVNMAASEESYGSSSDDDEIKMADIHIPKRAMPVPRAQAQPQPEPELTGSDSDIFWAVISRFQWRNATDGAPPVNEAKNVIKRLSDDNYKAFKREYDAVLHTTRIVLHDIFVSRNIGDEAGQIKVASHIMALGQDQYQTCMDCIDIVEFFIDNRDCSAFIP